MKTKVMFLALMTILLVSVTALTVSFQVSTVKTSVGNVRSAHTNLGERMWALAERIPEPFRSHFTDMLLRSNLASEDGEGAPQVYQEVEVEHNITVGRTEYAIFIVDSKFAAVRAKWPVYDTLYYTADTMYVLNYEIDIAEGTDPGNVTLTDLWFKNMVWGTGSDIAKPYYLWFWDSDIPGAGPEDYYPKLGLLSINFDPEMGPRSYYLSIYILARRGHVNQFATKPTVVADLLPKTKPSLEADRFYDVRLAMRGFKVKGSPFLTIVYLGVPWWQSTENGVYVKNMDPITTQYHWGGADPPDVPGPEDGYGEWDHFNMWGPPPVDPSFPAHFLQVGFEKSEVIPGPNVGSYLYEGAVMLEYFNRGFGIVVGNTPQLTLSSDDWDISVSNGLYADVMSMLEYYFEEPKTTIVTIMMP